MQIDRTNGSTSTRVLRAKLAACLLLAALSYQVPHSCLAEPAQPTDSVSTNLIANPGFEIDADWQVDLHNGALGGAQRDAARFRTGASSLKLTKTNGLGYVDLSSTQPIHVAAGVVYTFRGYFHSEDAPVSSLLLFRVSPNSTPRLSYNSIDKSAGYSSQSLLRNSPPGRWEERVVTFRSTREDDVTLHIILYGNPCSVWIDDLEFTDARYKAHNDPGPAYDFPYSEQQIQDALAKREASAAQTTVSNGQTELLLNGRPIPPVLYKGIYSTDTRGDYQQFGADGIPLCITTVKLGPESADGQAVWTGHGQIDFQKIDQHLMSVLRKNPRANIILDFWVYPYRAWGQEHPTEIITNARGEHAYGSWGNLEGFTDDLSKVDTAKARHWWYPSYDSLQWRSDAGDALRQCVDHIQASPLGKCVVGYYLTGGQDGGFLNDFFTDCSAPAQQAFRAWCQRHYASPAAVASAWKMPISSWDDIKIPENGEPENQEALSPFLDPGRTPDYRAFRAESSWALRDYFAGAVKAASTKPVMVFCYGEPSFDESFLNSKWLDGCGSMAYYPFRVPGYATGWKPLSRLALHHKLFWQEIDLRSWVGNGYAEVENAWIGAGDTPARWDAINRKLVGLSLANNWGYWYYDMNQYFNAPQIHRELAASFAAATRCYAAALTAPAWHPDVALVITDQPRQYISARFTSVGTAQSAGLDQQGMELETSGVPYDKLYLDDILNNPDLQHYRVYIFDNDVFLSQAQRTQIDRLLKSQGRTLVWMYDTGYISEAGKSLDDMSRLCGMRIGTEQTYARGTPIVEASANPLVQGLLPFQSSNELYLSQFTLNGGAQSLLARPQLFWIDDPSAAPLARYAETGRVAMAQKRFADWNSICIAAPNALGGDLLNNIARQAGAYVAGPAGESLDMNGHFVSLHGMKSGSYTLTLPPGKHRVLDAESEKLLSAGPTYTFPVEAQQTYWFDLE